MVKHLMAFFYNDMNIFCQLQFFKDCNLLNFFTALISTYCMPNFVVIAFNEICYHAQHFLIFDTKLFGENPQIIC